MKDRGIIRFRRTVEDLRHIIYLILAAAITIAIVWAIAGWKANEDDRRAFLEEQKQQIRAFTSNLVTMSQSGVEMIDSGKTATGATAEVLEELRGALSDMRGEIKTIGNDVHYLAGTLTAEVRNRSEDFGKTQAALTETVKSVNRKLDGEEVKSILADLSASSNGLKVLVNDSHLKTMLSSSDDLLASAARSGKKFEVVLDKAVEIETTAEESNKKFALFASDFQTFSHKYLNPDKPKGFWQKFKTYTLEVLGYGRDGATVVRIYRDLTGRVR